MIPKVKILNVGFNPASYEEIVSFLQKKENRTGYICFPDLYNIIRANEDETIKTVYDCSTLTLSDGKPSEFLLRRKGFKKAITISGYWLCLELLKKTELSHFFYGTSEENLALMKRRLTSDFPSANILGFKSPPFVSESGISSNSIIAQEIDEIKKLNPNIIWVGIGSPKQDLLMYHFHSKKEGSVMIGVGAVFDYFAGTAKMGPEWIKKMGFRWLYQLIKDPDRYSSRLMHIIKKLPFLLMK